STTMTQTTGGRWAFKVGAGLFPLLLLGGCAPADTESSEESARDESNVVSCAAIAGIAVKASGDDGNVASNAIDGNLGTRWSSLGKGSWIQLDLGAKGKV